MRRKPTLKAFKYRIYPNDAQMVFFAKTFGCFRLVWNKILDDKQQSYKKKDRIPRPTKLCHRCGYKDKDLALHERMWICPVCGETHDRDVNASINLYYVGLGRPEVTPVEQSLVTNRSHPATKQESQLQKLSSPQS